MSMIKSAIHIKSGFNENVYSEGRWGIWLGKMRQAEKEWEMTASSIRNMGILGGVQI